jgi:dolichol-phosphate mannosyltransferase
MFAEKGQSLAPRSSTLIALATYNEIENLPDLVRDIFAFAPDVEVLVIDDNSADGTGKWCDEQAAHEPRLHCLHRPGKLGLGTATVAGMQYALEHGYEYLITMDADFSHHPRFLPAIRGRIADVPLVDVVVGSRYVPGGQIVGWPWHRRLMSRLINAYARLLAGLPVRDCSGAFRLYRTETLRRMDPARVSSAGYAYLEEILWLLQRMGARFAEVPIEFVDRQRGQTKINWREALAAVWTILRLALRSKSKGPDN